MSQGNTAGPAIPLAFTNANANPVGGADQDTGATNGVFATINFNTNRLQFHNGIISRPTAAEFRALIPGYYRIAFDLDAWPNANDRSWDTRIFLNGTTELPEFRGRSMGKGSIMEANSNSKNHIVQLAANDTFVLQVAPAAGAIIHVTWRTSMLFELVRPI